MGTFGLQNRTYRQQTAHDKPTAATIEEMATRGLTRAQMAKEMKVTYAMLSRWIANTGSLNDAYNKGKETYETGKHQHAKK